MSVSFRNFKLKLFITSLALVFGLATFAVPSALAKSRTLASERDQFEFPFAVFGGLEGGYHSVDATGLGLSESLKGPIMGAKIGATFDHRLFTASASVGWMYSRLSAETRRYNSGLFDVSSTTRVGFLELSPRAKIVGAFELGPYVRWVFGTNPAFGDLGQPDDNFPLLGGLLATYTFDANPFQVRVGASFGTDLNLKDRQLYVGLVGVELGIPFYEVGGEGRRTQTKIIEKVIVQEAINFALDDQVLHFATNKAELNDASTGFMNEIANYLNGNQEGWESLRIEGHTDNRGSDEYNQALSERRAETVRNILANAGIPAERLTSQGLGEAKPIAQGDNEKAWAANRRIEMIFKGVKDPEAFRSEINRIKFRAFAK